MLIAQGNGSYMELMTSNEEILKPVQGTEFSFDGLLDALAMGSEDSTSDKDEPVIGLILPVGNLALINMQPDELGAYDVEAAEAAPFSKVESKGMPNGFDLNTVISQQSFTFDTPSQEYTIDSSALAGQDAPEPGDMELPLDRVQIQVQVPNETVIPKAAAPVQSIATNLATQDLNQVIDTTNKLNEALSPDLLNQSKVIAPTMPPMKNKADVMNDSSSDLEADDYRVELVTLDKENLAFDKTISGQANQQGPIHMVSKGALQSSTENSYLLGSSNQNVPGKGNPTGNYQADIEPKFFVHSSGEKANLHIHQKNIGDITASIEMDHNKSSVTLIADNNEVKQLLQSQLSQLKTIFSESNLNLVQANVEDKSSQQGHGKQERHTQTEFENNINSLDGSKQDQGLMTHQQNTLIDTYV